MTEADQQEFKERVARERCEHVELWLDHVQTFKMPPSVTGICFGFIIEYDDGCKVMGNADLGPRGEDE